MRNVYNITKAKCSKVHVQSPFEGHCVQVKDLIFFSVLVLSVCSHRWWCNRGLSVTKPYAQFSVLTSISWAPLTVLHTCESDSIPQTHSQNKVVLNSMTFTIADKLTRTIIYLFVYLLHISAYTDSNNNNINITFRNCKRDNKIIFYLFNININIIYLLYLFIK